MSIKNVDLDNSYSKAEIIADELIEMITSDQLSGKLPSESMLAQEYQVNIKTANKAVAKLIDTGYAYRKRGIGTFARDNTKKTEDEYSESTVALFMPSQGHLYEDLYNSLTKSLKENHIYPILMNSDSGISLEESRNLIDQAIRFNCKMLTVAHLYSSQFDYDYLETKQKLFDKIILINCREQSKTEALRILTDPTSGAFKATEHLLEKGCRRILYVNHANESCSDKYQIVKDNFYRGYHRALKDSGIKKEITFGEGNDNNANIRQLEKVLTKHHPDGVLCIQDNRAMRVIKAAEVLGLKIPGDLMIVGYYNTPWSRLSVPQLTSVSICEKQIANTLCDKINTDDFIPEKVIIKPEVVVRESTDTR